MNNTKVASQILAQNVVLLVFWMLALAVGQWQALRGLQLVGEYIGREPKKRFDKIVGNNFELAKQAQRARTRMGRVSHPSHI